MTRCKNIPCRNDLPERTARNGKALVFCSHACKQAYAKWAYATGAMLIDAIATKDDKQIDNATDIVLHHLNECGR